MVRRRDSGNLATQSSQSIARHSRLGGPRNRMGAKIGRRPLTRAGAEIIARICVPLPQGEREVGALHQCRKTSALFPLSLVGEGNIRALATALKWVRGLSACVISAPMHLRGHDK